MGNITLPIIGKVLYYKNKPCIFINNNVIIFFACDYCGNEDGQYDYNLLGEPCCGKCGGLIR
jgi:hypothetical protein